MVNSVVRKVGSWLLVTKVFKGYSLSIFMRDWLTSISINPLRVSKVTMRLIPNLGGLKLNFDGSSKGNLGTTGWVCA